jgi:Peptidase family S41
MIIRNLVRLRGLIGFLLGLLLAASSAGVQAQDTANLADFDFVVATVEANYAGWPTKTAGTKGEELAALTAQVRQTVTLGDDAQLRQAVDTWISWFDDGHLQAQWNLATADKAWRAPRRGSTEPAAHARLAKLGAARHPVEGIWTIDDRYRLAVLRDDKTPARFLATVLSTSAEGWQAGDIKAIMTEREDGSFTLRYGAGDRTELALTARLVSRNDVFDVGEPGIWRRVHDDPATALAALHRYPGEEFTLVPLGPETLYLRLPSFGANYTDTVRDLIEQNRALLAATPNLIIDVRRNGGGSAFVYDPVLPWIATRPIWRVGVEIRVSPLNQRLRREVADRIAAASIDAARTLRDESDRMDGNPAPFIRREPPVEIVSFIEALPNPARVAILIDEAGSSAENFLLDARQSVKVALLGQENSAEVIDFGEMMELPAPSGRFQLAWATTRSLRLPGDPVDPEGIAPDVRIPADADDPVAWAAAWLATRTER